MKKAIIYTLAFIAINLIASAVVMGVNALLEGHQVDMTPTIMIEAMALYCVATLAVFLFLKWAPVSRTYLMSRPWTVMIWSAIAALGALIPSAALQELLPDLPNTVEEEMDMLLKNRMGYFIVALLVPLVEELVFRGAVLRALLQWRSDRPWIAIVISAVFFAAIHFNPAQMIHPFLVGLLVGWMFYRTGSIIPGVVYHWVNNSAAFLVYAAYPDPSIKLIDILGGSQRSVWMAVAFSLCLLVPAIFQLNQWMRKAE